MVGEPPAGDYITSMLQVIPVTVNKISVDTLFIQCRRNIERLLSGRLYFAFPMTILAVMRQSGANEVQMLTGGRERIWISVIMRALNPG